MNKLSCSSLLRNVGASILGTWSFLFIVSGQAATTPEPKPNPCNLEFGLREKGARDLRDHIHETLLHINMRNFRGTAFLVDKENGLYVTAGHVVAALAPVGNAVDRLGYNINANDISGKKKKLRIVNLECTASSCKTKTKNSKLVSADFAILQVKKEDRDNSIEPLNFRFEPPKSQDTHQLRYSGFGSSGINNPNDPRTISADGFFSMVRKHDHIYHGQIKTDEGDSGSPVFSNKGEVFAIVVETGGSQSIFHGIDQYAPLVVNAVKSMKRERYDKIFETLDDMVSSGQPENLRLGGRLQGGKLTNLDLAMLFEVYWESIKNYTGFMFNCLVYRMGSQRALGQYSSAIEGEAYRRRYANTSSAELIRYAQNLKQENNASGALIVNEMARSAASLEILEILSKPFGQRAIAGVVARNEDSLVPLADAVPDNEVSHDIDFADIIGRVARPFGASSSPKPLITVDANNLKNYETYTSDTLAVAFQHYARTITEEKQIRGQIGLQALPEPELVKQGIQAAEVGQVVARSPKTIKLLESTVNILRDLPVPGAT